MSTASSHTIRTSSPSITYVPTPSKADQIAEAIGCILAGRPLPPHLRAQPTTLTRPATVSEGVARILAPTRA